MLDDNYVLDYYGKSENPNVFFDTESHLSYLLMPNGYECGW